MDGIPESRVFKHVDTNLQTKKNFKGPVRSDMQRGRCMRGVAPGKKPGAMQQRNIEVKTKKKKLTTPLELEMVVGPVSHLSLLPREGLAC